MEKTLQNILLPSSKELELHFGLFYRGPRCITDRENHQMKIANNVIIDFATYFNGCTYAKWKKYTELRGATLVLCMEGKFSITLVGYCLDVYSPVRNEFGTYDFDLEDKQEIQLNFPDNDETIIGFEVRAEQNVVIYSGEYRGVYDRKELNNVELCLATTTCRKEKFIKKNVESIKKEILDSDDEMKNHFYVHVVDNGRTLKKKDIDGWHVKLHPNKNTGGSGGFSRGMIEAIEQNPKATHVLLMDDDVIILPESLKRTYRLLQLVVDQYKNSFISGAMLYYEEMNIQHEDIGTLRSNCDFWSLKGRLYQDRLYDNLLNEQYFYGADTKYAGWWYCCIPTEIIEKEGLSLPIFIRCDDMEYSLRCHADIITMNGICIWHMGFVNKYNLAFDRYQQCRNLLIDQAVGSIGNEVNVIKFVKTSFVMELVRFNYNGARLVMRAVQDYMKGPEFLEKDNGEKIIQENAKLNEKFISLSEYQGIEWDIPDIYNNPKRNFWQKWWYRITYNGQRLWPEKWLKKDIECVLFSIHYQPKKYLRRNKMLVVNPDLKTGCIRKIDKKQYREIKKEWHMTLRKLKKNQNNLQKQYRKKKEYLTSVGFWKEYLEIK